MNNKNINNNEKGNTTIGLLIMVLFIGSMVLLNTPNLALTNKVAYATGGGGGGASVGIVGGSVASSAGMAEDALITLQRIASTPVTNLAAGNLSNVVANVSLGTDAVTTLSNEGRLAQNKTMAAAAVKQLLMAVIEHTISIIQKRIIELSTVA